MRRSGALLVLALCTLLTSCTISDAIRPDTTPASRQTFLPTVSLTAAPIVIQAGDSSMLIWSSNDADTIMIDGVGMVAASGATSVTPMVTTTYTITASGAGGTVMASVTVIVMTPPPPTN